MNETDEGRHGPDSNANTWQTMPVEMTIIIISQPIIIIDSAS